MNDTTRLMTPTELWEWLQANASGLLLPVGVVLAVTLAVLLRRAILKGTADGWAVTVAVLLATAFSAEGMFEVAVERLGLPPYLAGGLFLVAEAAMLASAVRAHRHYQRHGNLGPHARFVWLIAAFAGVVVSFNSTNVVEFALRLLLPLLAAGLWWMGYQDDVTTKRATGAVTWRWHPRRLAIVLGIIEPGEDDIAQVHRERQTRAMTTLAHRVHTGGRRLRGWRIGRLARSALLADDAMVTEVASRVARAHHIVTLTMPMAMPADMLAAVPAVEVTTEPELQDTTRDVTPGPTSTAASRPRKTTTSGGSRRHTTAERVAKAAAKTPTATAAQIAVKLGVSERTVQRHLPKPDTTTTTPTATTTTATTDTDMTIAVDELAGAVA